jgi:hypothetical protein
MKGNIVNIGIGEIEEKPGKWLVARWFVDDKTSGYESIRVDDILTVDELSFRLDHMSKHLKERIGNE